MIVATMLLLSGRHLVERRQGSTVALSSPAPVPTTASVKKYSSPTL